MCTHFRTRLVSSGVIGVALRAACPSPGSAIPLLPETTSGTAQLEGQGGGVTVFSGEDRIAVG